MGQSSWEELLSLRQAAAAIGYSESGLRKLIKQRLIRYSKPGGRYRFRREWLDAFVARGESSSGGSVKRARWAVRPAYYEVESAWSRV